MKVTYIHHSSFSVELSEAVLLFDYFEGPLPQLPGEKPLFVFASHGHGDHFSPVIFRLAEGRENVRYILSGDIPQSRVPEEQRENTVFVKPGELLDFGDLVIETFRSTDEGVAFWITCGKKAIYHAGDLNNWRWEGEDPAWNRNMDADYRREMEKLAGRTADAAFIPLDPRLEQWFYLGMEGFMARASAKAVFPMHFWENYGIIEKMREHPASEGWRERLIPIHREGEEFVL